MSVHDNPSNRGNIPAQLRGRQFRGGPSSGNMVTIPVYLQTMGAGATDTYFVIPGAPFRITQIYTACESITLTPTIAVANGSVSNETI